MPRQMAIVATRQAPTTAAEGTPDEASSRRKRSRSLTRMTGSFTRLFGSRKQAWYTPNTANSLREQVEELKAELSPLQVPLPGMHKHTHMHTHTHSTRTDQT